MCEGNYTYSSTGQCVCELFGIDRLTCVKECGTLQKADSSPTSDIPTCACQNNFIRGDKLECVCNNHVSLDGNSCVEKCNLGEEDVGGRCQCIGRSTKDERTNTCKCPHHWSVDHKNCVDECPRWQTDVEGVCTCVFGFDQVENTAECECRNYLSQNGLQCLSQCGTNQVPQQTDLHPRQC